MSDKVEFPKWRGYDNLENMMKLVSIGCDNDPKQILEYAAKMTFQKIYLKDVLLFIQDRVQKHIENGEGLGLGIDSSREVFEGLMLVPAEEVAFPTEDENDKDKYEQFIEDMKRAGIECKDYDGRFFYHGPSVRTNEKGFPTRQDVIRATKVKVQWDNMGTDFVIYPV